MVKPTIIIPYQLFELYALYPCRKHCIISFPIFCLVQELTTKQAATASSGFWSGVSSSVQKATTSLWLRNPDQEFAKQLKYVNNLSEKLATLEKTGNKIQEERSGIVNCYIL